MPRKAPLVRARLVRARLVVVGSSNTDMVVAGEALPRPGETLVGGSFYTALGGKGANQAVAAARCASPGSRVALVAAVGDDEIGRAAAKGLRAEGLDCSHLKTVKGVPSGVALIMVDRRGENLIAVAPGANGRLSAKDVAEASGEIAKADVLLAQLETTTAAVKKALELASKAGARTILDPAPAPPPGPGRPIQPSLLKRIGVLTPNETEFEALTGARIGGRGGGAAARNLARLVREALIVTEGAKGVRVFTRAGDEYRVDAFEVRAVDTVAAGDAFSGALAVMLAEGRDLRGAIRFASAAAALSVTRRGAQPSLPRRREVEAFLRRRSGKTGKTAR